MAHRPSNLHWHRSFSRATGRPRKAKQRWPVRKHLRICSSEARFVDVLSVSIAHARLESSIATQFILHRSSQGEMAQMPQSQRVQNLLQICGLGVCPVELCHRA